jgi:hypothetical protein
MPDPKLLKVGDRVRFVSIPTEWSAPGYDVPREDMTFMKRMIKRTRPSRVYQLDYLGYPWIRAVMRHGKKTVYHFWMISDSTGWRKVSRRVQHQ